MYEHSLVITGYNLYGCITLQTHVHVLVHVYDCGVYKIPRNLAIHMPLPILGIQVSIQCYCQCNHYFHHYHLNLRLPFLKYGNTTKPNTEITPGDVVFINATNVISTCV